MMADYIRREDARRMVVQLDKYAWKSPVSDERRVTVDVDLVKFGLDRIPAADVAEVTRCKDCKYVRNLGFNFGGLRHDSYFCVYNGPVSTGGDDFCSHGELQTNGGGSNDVSG